MSAELMAIRAKINRRKVAIARLDRVAELDRAQLEAAIREADRLFFDGSPGRACALIRDTRKQLDGELVAA